MQHNAAQRSGTSDCLRMCVCVCVRVCLFTTSSDSHLDLPCLAIVCRGVDDHRGLLMVPTGLHLSFNLIREQSVFHPLYLQSNGTSICYIMEWVLLSHPFSSVWLSMFRGLKSSELYL